MPERFNSEIEAAQAVIKRFAWNLQMVANGGNVTLIPGHRLRNHRPLEGIDLTLPRQTGPVATFVMRPL